MKDKRRDGNIECLQKAKNAWDEANPAEIDQQYILSENLIDDPKHKTFTEIAVIDKKNFRKACDLTEVFQDIKDHTKDPGLQYIEKPEIKSKKELDKARALEYY